MVKNFPARAGDTRTCEFDPWVRKIPWRRKWQLTPVFLPVKSHGERSLAGCSPWGHKESDMAEQQCMQHAHRLRWCTYSYLMVMLVFFPVNCYLYSYSFSIKLFDFFLLIGGSYL